jgi:hypothetical protein
VLLTIPQSAFGIFPQEGVLRVMGVFRVHD